jgi:hypothetical protein
VAGIEAGADAIITWNLGDFPTAVIGGYGFEVRTFVLHFWNANLSEDGEMRSNYGVPEHSPRARI